MGAPAWRRRISIQLVSEYLLLFFFCLIWICDERQRVLFSAYRKWSVCPSHWWTPSTNCLRHNKPSWLLLATFNNSWWKDLLLKRNRHIRQEPWGTIGHDSCLRSRPAGRRRRFEKKKKENLRLSCCLQSKMQLGEHLPLKLELTFQSTLRHPTI